MAGKSLNSATNGRQRAPRFRAVVFAFLLFLVQSAVAITQFDVFIGFDGTVREASWFPIVCEMRNDGPPISGFIEVSANFAKGQTQIVPIELPSGTTKRITIPVFAYGRYASRWDVRLLNERHKVIEEKAGLVATRQIGWETPLLGSLSRTASGAPAIRQIARNQADAQPATARLQQPIFPDNALVLEGMNAFYLNSTIAPTLREPQVNALLGWVHAGGHLIVAVEQVSDVNALAWLKGILPVAPKDSTSVKDHSQFHTWLRDAEYQKNIPESHRRQGGRPKAGVPVGRPFGDLPSDSQFELADLPVINSTVKDGKVILQSGGVPLMVTANRGNGRVTALLFSPELEPFKSWKHLTAFWAAMAEVPGELYTMTDYYPGFGRSADAIFGAMVDSRQVHKLPKGWLFLLLIVYLVVIGPFDQWWLKRIKKPMLTWITFPCYVILFSALIYFIGYKLRAGDSECNELHVVDVLANADGAMLRGRTYTSIYSPANQSYPMSCQETPSTLRGEFLSSGGGLATEAFTTLLSGDNFKSDVYVPVWTSQLYIGDWWQPSPIPPVALQVTKSGGGWNVAVHNRSSKAIKGANIVIDGGVYSLGELASGAQKSFNLSASGGQQLSEFVRQHGGSFLHAVERRQSAFGDTAGGTIDDFQNATLAASFVSEISSGNNNQYDTFVPPRGLDLSESVTHGNAVLFAWMPDHSATAPLGKFRPLRSFHHTMWRVTAPVK